MLENKCYRSWDVNYVMFGWMNKLCDIPSQKMISNISLHKYMTFKEDEINAAWQWAEIGYNNTWDSVPKNLPDQPEEYKACSNCKTKQTGGLYPTWPSTDPVWLPWE